MATTSKSKVLKKKKLNPSLRNLTLEQIEKKVHAKHRTAKKSNITIKSMIPVIALLTITVLSLAVTIYALLV